MPSPPKPGPHSPDRDFTDVALRTFANIAREWGLSEAEQAVILGGRDPLSLTACNDDELERISLILGIYQDINILLPVRERANAWMRAENSAFGGATALEIMTAGGLAGLFRIRRYLAAEAN